MKNVKEALSLSGRVGLGLAGIGLACGASYSGVHAVGDIRQAQAYGQQAHAYEVLSAQEWDKATDVNMQQKSLYDGYRAGYLYGDSSDKWNDALTPVEGAIVLGGGASMCIIGLGEIMSDRKQARA